MARMTKLHMELGKVQADNTLLKDQLYTLSAREKEVLKDTTKIHGVVLTIDEVEELKHQLQEK
ncbi:hypothetical protein GOP47_0022379 [Adiantum capillus-veneris]|uniref:Uncharacterized protein n=1 Tax=Adiantum capillus-veneris TaxID=13818 RepID=A0A9D4Z5G4_ADICA|nr:hypothetical protein GOP47_0022379 [Adiantum capillus-veneris]